MPKPNLNQMLSQSATRSTPLEIRRGKGVGLSVEETADELLAQVRWMEIDSILDNPYQHAEEINDEDFAALVESIKLDGFQGALNVTPVEGREGYYFITSGGHQGRDAAKAAGLDKLPVFIGASPAEKKQLGLRLARENTAQVNRSPVNLGFLYLQLIEEFGMTQEEIATEIKKDRYHVNLAMMAARSAADIRAALREKYSPCVMTYLRRVESAEDRAPVIEKYLSGELSVEGVRVSVEQVLAEKKAKQNTAPAPNSTVEEVSQPQAAETMQEDKAPSGQDEQANAIAATGETKEQRGRALLEQVKTLVTDEDASTEQHRSSGAETFEAQERVSKAQAAFSRIETYRRYIEGRRADGEVVILSDQEAALLGKIIDRCHTLLDTYKNKL